MNVNDIAPDSTPGPEGESFKFEAVGDKVEGKVVHFDTFTSESKFTKARQRVLVISLEQADGSVLKIYPVINTNVDDPDEGYPTRMARAIADAIKANGQTDLEEGSTLAVQYNEEIPTKFGNPAKGFVAEYKAPAANGASADGAVAGLISGGD